MTYFLSMDDETLEDLYTRAGLGGCHMVGTSDDGVIGVVRPCEWHDEATVRARLLDVGLMLAFPFLHSNILAVMRPDPVTLKRLQEANGGDNHASLSA
jgi:hypothetical protein